MLTYASDIIYLRLSLYLDNKPIICKKLTVIFNVKTDAYEGYIITNLIVLPHLIAIYQ